MGIDILDDPEAWITAWQEHLNDSDEYAEAGEGWGVDFEGSFLFEVTPAGALDEPMYFYVDPHDGEIREARVVDDPESVDYGFRYTGDFDSWKKLIQGEVGAIDGLMGGDFEVDGDMQKVLQYSQAATVMTGAAAEIDTEFPE
ncbi:sterol carrier protein [Halobacteriales archaeon QS_8_69_26]|nr:MAG: sterol carrier protein [Halobacteriales archaeon QS_8_69_26]